MDFEQYKKEVLDIIKQNQYIVNEYRAPVLSRRIYYNRLDEVSDDEIIVITNFYDGKSLSIKESCCKNKKNLKHLIFDKAICGFKGCDNLKTIYYKVDIHALNMNDFENCNIEDIFYDGTKEEFDNIKLINKYNYFVKYQLGIKDKVIKRKTKGYKNFLKINIHCLGDKNEVGNL